MKDMIEEIANAVVFIYKIKNSLFCLSREIQCEIKENDELDAMFKLYEDITKYREGDQLILHESQKIKLRKAYTYLKCKSEKIENTEKMKKYGCTIAVNNDWFNHEYKKFLSKLNEKDIKGISEQIEMRNFVEVYLIRTFGKEYIIACKD